MGPMVAPWTLFSGNLYACVDTSAHIQTGGASRYKRISYHTPFATSLYILWADALSVVCEWGEYLWGEFPLKKPTCCMVIKISIFKKYSFPHVLVECDTGFRKIALSFMPTPQYTYFEFHILPRSWSSAAVKELAVSVEVTGHNGTSQYSQSRLLSSSTTFSYLYSHRCNTHYTLSHPQELSAIFIIHTVS